MSDLYVGFMCSDFQGLIGFEIIVDVNENLWISFVN